MKKIKGLRAGAMVLLASAVTVTAMAHELADDATMAERAYVYRDSLFHVIGWKAGIMFGMAKGEVPEDPALFAKTAREIAALAPSVPEGFIPDSLVEGSLAEPSIWENMDDFKAKADDMQDVALEIADAAEEDFGKAKGMMRKFGGTCGACHRKYKVDTD